VFESSKWFLVGRGQIKKQGGRDADVRSWFKRGMALLVAEGNVRESASLFVGITVRNQIYCLLASPFYAFDDLHFLAAITSGCFWMINKHLIEKIKFQCLNCSQIHIFY